MEYFKHNYNARSETGILNLRMELGYEGYGIYWAIIERLFESGGELSLAALPAIAYDLRIDGENGVKKLERVVYGFDLFDIDEEGGIFTSEAVTEQLKDRADKSAAARKSIGERWKKARTKKANGGGEILEQDTPVIRPYNERNTTEILTEESITEESIREKSITEGECERETELPPRPSRKFKPPTLEEVETYCADKGYRIDAQYFIDYYTANGWKVGKNPMKDWRAAVRMWATRDKGGGKPPGKNGGSILDEMSELYSHYEGGGGNGETQ